MVLTAARMGIVAGMLAGMAVAQTLQPGTSVERTLAKAQTDSFNLALDAGVFVRIRVSHSTKGLEANLRDPSGAIVATGEDPGNDDEEFSLGYVTTSNAALRLEVTNRGATAWTAKITLVDMRATHPGDGEVLEAEKSELDGLKLAASGRREDAQASIPKFERALKLWRAASDRAGEAHALCDLGDANRVLNEYAKAIEFHNQALQLRDAVANPRWEATVLRKIGDSYSNSGKFPQAAEQFDRALALQRRENDIRGLAITLNARASVYYIQGDFQKAIDCLTEALPLRRQSLDQRGEAYTLHSIGTIHLASGEQRKASEYFEQALPLWREAGERRGEATTLNNLAALHSELGQQQEAFGYLNRALQIYKDLGDRRGEGNALANVAHIHAVLGDFATALDYDKQALALARAGHDRPSEGNILNNTGAALRKLGKPQAALDDYELALKAETEAGDRRLQGVTLSSIASTYQERGDAHKALEYYDRALPLHRAVNDRTWEGVTLTGMATSHSASGDQQKAYDSALQAQTVFQSIGARGYEARALYAIARIESARNNLDAALDRSKAALEIVESIRSSVERRDLQVSFFATAREQYELQIELLMKLHRDAEAFESFERARARGLLDILAEQNADIRQGVPAVLLDRERSLEESLDARTDRQLKLLAAKHTDRQAEEAASGIRSILAQYQEVEAQIRRESPRYAAVTHPQPLPLAEIQQSLEKDTLLLEYALGAERSYLWAVTHDSIATFELPKRRDLESLASRLTKAWSTNAPAGDRQEASDASRILLRPVSQLLPGKRLVIVNEGALQYLPYAALLGETGKRLVMDHEITHLPSASTLVILRRELSGRQRAEDRLAVLADPVYSRSDSRVKTATRGTAAPDEFDRLRSSRDEAANIAALWPSGSMLKALDFDANRTLATSGALAPYRIVHIASHGVLNADHPELSGIVLSQVDEKGNPREGFLRAHDVFNMRLTADLVVLSACQTGLGADIKGEGLVGLTRAFFYAGAARVMASLWAVPDGGSAELMKIFYSRMRTRHMQPAAALRSAQIAMMQDVRFRDPYYWAAFTIQGEYR